MTVFTATYNRGYIIERLYESLAAQTRLDFEWVVVDDGSSDGTEGLIRDLAERAPFPVVYERQENSGKHIAINRGARLATGEWFFMVDSDDALTPDAVERCLKWCGTVEADPSFAGVVGLRGDETGNVWGSLRGGAPSRGAAPGEPGTYVDATSLEYRYKLGLGGDRAEVVRTDVLRAHPFPQYGDEKFLVEGWLWNTLAKEGLRFRWFNDVVYLCEYLDDGLTRHIADHYRNSSQGGLPWRTSNFPAPKCPFWRESSALTTTLPTGESPALAGSGFFGAAARRPSRLSVRCSRSFGRNEMNH